MIHVKLKIITQSKHQVPILMKRNCYLPKCQLRTERRAIVQANGEVVLDQHTKRRTMICVVDLIVTLVFRVLALGVFRGVHGSTSRVCTRDKVGGFRLIKTITWLHKHTGIQVRTFLQSNGLIIFIIKQEINLSATGTRCITLDPSHVTAGINVKVIQLRRITYVDVHMVGPARLKDQENSINMSIISHAYENTTKQKGYELTCKCWNMGSFWELQI